MTSRCAWGWYSSVRDHVEHGENARRAAHPLRIGGEYLDRRRGFAEERSVYERLVRPRDGTQLRVTADPRESFAPNAIVWVTLPPDRCRALVG